MAKQPPVNESDPKNPDKIYYVVRVDNELKVRYIFYNTEIKY